MHSSSELLKSVLKKMPNSLIFYPIRNPHIPKSTKVYSQIFFKFLYFSKFNAALCSIKMLFTKNQREGKNA